MKSLLIIALALVTCGAQAGNPILFYNGDLDQTGDPRDNGLSSERNGAVSDSQTYDNFTLTATHGFTSIFGNFQDTQSSLCTTMFYDIRNGITEGNGGVDLFSGIVACTGTATGRSLFGAAEIHYEGSVNFTLGAGTYFMAISPISTGTGRDFVSTTLGLNAVNNFGHPNGQQFINSSSFGLVWNNWQDLLGQGNWDCSYGATTGDVPEPASLAFLGLGVFAVAARRKDRASR